MQLFLRSLFQVLYSVAKISTGRVVEDNFPRLIIVACDTHALSCRIRRIAHDCYCFLYIGAIAHIAHGPIVKQRLIRIFFQIPYRVTVFQLLVFRVEVCIPAYRIGEFYCIAGKAANVPIVLEGINFTIGCF